MNTSTLRHLSPSSPGITTHPFQRGLKVLHVEKFNLIIIGVKIKGIIDVKDRTNRVCSMQLIYCNCLSLTSFIILFFTNVIFYRTISLIISYIIFPSACVCYTMHVPVSQCGELCVFVEVNNQLNRFHFTNCVEFCGAATTSCS